MPPTSLEIAAIKLIHEATELESLFGHRLNYVHPLLLRIARLSDPYPQWLRGTRRMTDLPRFSTAKGLQRLPQVGLSSLDIAKRINYIVEDLSEEWRWFDDTFCFASDIDIVVFKLRWS